MVWNGIGPNPLWFDAVGYLKSAVGADDARYIWWSAAVGGSIGLYLYDMTELGALAEPAYPAMTSENIAAIGLSEVFRLWMVHYLWTQSSTG